MYRVRVKVCGVTNVVDARMVEREGGDAIGFVLWPQSPRVIPAARVAEITRVLSPLTARIGVFYDADLGDVEKTVKRTGLTAAQICGTAPGNQKDWKGLSRRVRLIRVVAANADSMPKEPPWFFCNDYIFYSGTPELPGGRRLFDWSLIPKNKDRLWGRIYISGGLTAQNVGDLIKTYRPDVVDVSATVEGENARKDPGLVHEFVAAVREAEYEVSKLPEPVEEEEPPVEGNVLAEEVEEEEDVETQPEDR